MTPMTASQLPPFVQPIRLEHACRLVNHGPTVLVATRDGQRRNLMAAAWSMPVEFVPPRIAVEVDKKTFTRELLAASGMFALMLPTPPQATLTHRVGNETGREVGDKFVRHGLQVFDGPVLGLPLVAGCSAWLELRHIPEPHVEDAYDTVYGEVVAALADERVFRDGRWRFDEGNAQLHTLHHLGGGQFAVPSRVVGADGERDGG